MWLMMRDNRGRWEQNKATNRETPRPLSLPFGGRPLSLAALVAASAAGCFDLRARLANLQPAITATTNQVCGCARALGPETMRENRCTLFSSRTRPSAAIADCLRLVAVVRVSLR